MKFDEVLEHIGHFGRYQRWKVHLMCIPSIFSALMALSVVFVLDIPDHRCSLGENDTYAIQSEDHAHLLNMSIPWELDRSQPVRSSCYVYKQPINGSQHNNETTECTSWVFDKSTYESTLTEKFNIVCDHRIFRSHSNMGSFVGFLFGVLIYGLLADRFGRRPVVLVGLVIHVVSFIAISVSPNVYVYMVLRAISRMNMAGANVVLYVLVLEITGPSKRVYVGMIFMMAWGLGLFLLGFLAYFIRSWLILHLVVSVPRVAFAAYYWITPESPRWLISKGRIAEAQVIIKEMAKENGVDLPEEMLEKLTPEGDTKQQSITKMFQTGPLRAMTFIIFYNWFVCAMVYYGLGLNVQNLSGDIYLNFTIANISEMASYFFCMFLLDRAGRKVTHCLCMFSGGIACICTMFPVLYGTADHDWITVALSMVGKFGISGAFAIVYILSSELFPTVVRNSGVGASSFSARIGGIISPYIADLGVIVGGDLKIALPLIVFGAASVAAGFLSLYLPETLGRRLPETIEDAKEFMRSRGKAKKEVDGKAQPGIPEKGESGIPEKRDTTYM